MKQLKIIQCAKNCGKEIEAYRIDAFCDECRKENIKNYQSKYRKKEENIEKEKEFHRKYREENHEMILEKSRIYREKNNDILNKKARQAYQLNIEKNKERKRRYYLNNIEQHAKTQRQWKQNNPAKVIYQSSRLRAKKHGYASIANYMTLEEFENWFEVQSKECFVCGETENWCIDHDHETGKPRGILCNNHNLFEGLLGTVEHAKKLLQYMELHENNMEKGNDIKWQRNQFQIS